MSSEEATSQIDEKRRQAIIKQYKDKFLNPYAIEHRISVDSLDMCAIEKGLIDPVDGHIPELFGEIVTFGFAVVLADLQRHILNLQILDKEFNPDLIRGLARPKIIETAQWLKTQFPPRPGTYVRTLTRLADYALSGKNPLV